MVFIAGLVALTGIGAVGDVWPFQRWSMFSSPGPETSDFLVPVAVSADGQRRPQSSERLPGGYVRDLYQSRFEQADDAQRAHDCRRMLGALQEQDGDVVALELELWEWELLEREGRDPADVQRETVWRCPASGPPA